MRFLPIGPVEHYGTGIHGAVLPVKKKRPGVSRKGRCPEKDIFAAKRIFDAKPHIPRALPAHS